jgi:hypothetical protein
MRIVGNTNKEINMEAIITKIQKLLALGERGGTEAEATAAMQKVHELLAKHNLSLNDVKNAPDAEEDCVMDETTATAKQPWQDYIWDSIAKLYFCRHLKRTRYSGNKVTGVQHLTIGKPSNIAVVKYVAVYLIRTGEALAKEAAVGQDSRQTFINSFKKGFAIRVAGRVAEEIQKARDGKLADSATGTALTVLPLYEQAKREIDTSIQESNIHPRAPRGGRVGVSNYSGYTAGKEAANGVSLVANSVEGRPMASIAGGTA